MIKENEKISKETIILEEAEKEFFIKGYDGARTTSIAEHAGVTHAMLHYYYRTKEQLFEKVLDKNMSHIITIMLSVMDKTDLPLIERLKNGITSHFDFVASNPLLPRFIFNEVISRPERHNILQNKLAAIAREKFASIQKEIDELSQQGKIEWIDVRMLFISIMSLNIFPFIAYPVGEIMMGDVMADRDSFLEQRKKENVETIMRRIKKIAL